MPDYPTPPYPIDLPEEQANLPFEELPYSRQRKILAILQRNARRQAILDQMLEET